VTVGAEGGELELPVKTPQIAETTAAR